MYSPEFYLFKVPGIPDKSALATLAEQVFSRVFRHDFSASTPGFALLRITAPVPSQNLRQCMVALKEALSSLYQCHYGPVLNFLSLARFDQQVTTKFHLDGAPEEACLMLGYEPSAVQSNLALADYCRAAFELGITPQQFLTEYNPMFRRGEKQLENFITKVSEFEPTWSSILLINNSSQSYHPAARNQLGVMHQATILTPDPEKSRVVNSTMLVPARQEIPSSITEMDIARFVESQEVAKKLYEPTSPDSV